MYVSSGCGKHIDKRIWDGYGARESTVELRFREVECLAEEHTATERESLD